MSVLRTEPRSFTIATCVLTAELPFQFLRFISEQVILRSLIHRTKSTNRKIIFKSLESNVLSGTSIAS